MINETVKEIKEQLKPVNVVSFSGGKDSSAMLQLVINAIEGTQNKLIIVTSDTMMEIPFYQQYVDRNRIFAIILS